MGMVCKQQATTSLSRGVVRELIMKREFTPLPGKNVLFPLLKVTFLCWELSSGIQMAALLYSA